MHASKEKFIDTKINDTYLLSSHDCFYDNFLPSVIKQLMSVGASSSLPTCRSQCGGNGVGKTFHQFICNTNKLLNV